MEEGKTRKTKTNKKEEQGGKGRQNIISKRKEKDGRGRQEKTKKKERGKKGEKSVCVCVFQKKSRFT